MKARLMVLSTAIASSLFALSANAHDPKEFDRMMSTPEAKAVPTTCAQLADSHNYSTDVANADIKALKARCDAAKAATKAPSKPAASKTK